MSSSPKFLFFIILLMPTQFLLAQQVEWLQAGFGFGAFEDASSPTAIGVDSSGNSYIAGWFTGAIQLGNDTLNTNSLRNIYLAKYDKSGLAEWTRHIRTSGASEAHDIAVEPSGDFYITGFVSDTVFIDTDTFPVTINVVTNDIFIAKFSKDGDYIWANRIEGYLNDEGKSLAIDGGNIYLGGDFTNTTFFATDTVSSDNSEISDFFLASFGAGTGIELWVRTAGATPPETCSGLAVDSKGDIYATGSFRGVTNFDTVSLVSYGQGDFFLAKYSSIGEVVWAKNWGSTQDEFSVGLEIDDSDRLYIAGNFSKTLPMGTDTLTPPDGTLTTFIAQLDSNGTEIWARQSYPSEFTSNELEAFSVSKMGKILLIGWYGVGELTFGLDTISHLYNQRTFVGQMSTDGSHDWLIQDEADTTVDRSVGTAIVSGLHNEIHVVGYFANRIIWVTDTLENSVFDVGGNTNSYITVFGPEQSMSISPHTIRQSQGYSKIYPNPSIHKDKNVRIEFDIPDPQSVMLTIIELNGREIIHRELGIYPTGRHQIALETHTLPAGVYLYKLSGASFSSAGKWIIW